MNSFCFVVVVSFVANDIPISYDMIHFVMLERMGCGSSKKIVPLRWMTSFKVKLRVSGRDMSTMIFKDISSDSTGNELLLMIEQYVRGHHLPTETSDYEQKSNCQERIRLNLALSISYYTARDRIIAKRGYPLMRLGRVGEQTLGQLGVMPGDALVFHVYW